MRCKTAWSLPNSRLKFARDPINTSFTGRKEVSSLAIQIDAQSISLISLIPLACNTPLAVLPFAELKASIRRARRSQGFLASLFPAGGSKGVTVVDAKCIHGDWVGGPWVLIHGLFDSDICFWLWNPWGGSEGEEGKVQFLGEGPAELGDVEGVELVIFPTRHTLFVSTPSGSLFTKHILQKDKVVDDGGWQCHRLFEGRGVATRILRYGAESLLILAGAETRLALLYYSDVNEDGSGCEDGLLYHLESGYELPLGACDIESIEGCITPDGSSLVAILNNRNVSNGAGGGDICCLKVALGADLACPTGPPVINKAVSWWSRDIAWAALYRDDTISGDNVVLVVLNDAQLEAHLIGGSVVERMLRSPVDRQFALGVTDLTVEPDLEVKLLRRDGLVVADELQKRFSWAPPAQSKDSVQFEFANWFNLLEPFPYSDARCLAIVAQRHKAPLWIDEQLPRESIALYPPSSWSDLRLLSDNITSASVFLYLILDTQQQLESSSVAAAFCRRFCITAAEQRLVLACLKLDRGEDALFDLVLAQRGGLELPDRAVKLLHANPEARAVLGLADEPRRELQALVARGLVVDALQLARAESCFDALIDLLLASTCKQAALSLSFTRAELDALAKRSSEEPIIRFAIVHALRRKALGEAIRLYDSTAPPFLGVPAWKELKGVIDTVRSHGDYASVESDALVPHSANDDDDVEMAEAPVTRVIVTPTLGPANLSGNTSTDLLHLHHHQRAASPLPGSPQHLATASPSSGSRGSSPPLRSVKPRHVPPHRPSTLGQQHVESASDSHGESAGSDELMEGVFGEAGILDLLQEHQPESSSEDAADMEVESSSSSSESTPAAAAASSSSPDQSSSEEFIDDGTRYILTSPMVDDQVRYVLAAEPSPSPSPVTTPSRRRPHRYNLRPQSPIVYPKDGRASPYKRRHSPPATALLPGADETRSQFKKRVRKDLAIPSPSQSPALRRTAVKAAGEASASKTPSMGSPRRTSPRKAATPVKATPAKATPVKTTPAKATPVKATPTAGTPTQDTKTPPLRLTPITTDRRRRR